MRLALAFAALFGLGAVLQEPADPAPILGQGEHRFRWVDDWAQLPEGVELGYTHGCVAVDGAGNVYVQTNAEAAVFVFSPQGEHLRSFGEDLAGGLHGMCLVREGEEEFLYLTHLEGEVIKCTLEGEILWRLGYPKASGKYDEDGGERYHPTGVAVSAAGEIFVADGYGRHWIHRYDAERNYLGSFGGPGRDRGQLRNPHGLWIERRGGREILVVADRENRRLQLFDLEGKVLRVASEGLRRPCTGDRHPDGTLAVADIDGKVTLLDKNGAPVVHLGEQPDPEKRDRKDVPAAQQERGRFHSPHGVAWSPAGDLYVVEWQEAGRLIKLERLAAGSKPTPR